MGWAEVVIVALVIMIALLFLLNRAARPLASPQAKDRVEEWDGDASGSDALAPGRAANADEDVLAIEARAVKSAAGAIAAVKFVRERTGWGLAEAKAYVDRLQ